MVQLLWCLVSDFIARLWPRSVVLIVLLLVCLLQKSGKLVHNKWLTERLRAYGSLWPYAKRAACYASTGPGPCDIDPTADSSMGNEKLNGKQHVDENDVLGEQNGKEILPRSHRVLPEWKTAC